MLVMTLKKNSLLEIDQGTQLLKIEGVSKRGLIIKVLDKKQDGTYKDNGKQISTESTPLRVGNDLKVIHLKGSGNQIKVGFEGNSLVGRCPKKYKYIIHKDRNLDDDFFNFDTEGY